MVPNIYVGTNFQFVLRFYCDFQTTLHQKKNQCDDDNIISERGSRNYKDSRSIVNIELLELISQILGKFLTIELFTKFKKGLEQIYCTKLCDQLVRMTSKVSRSVSININCHWFVFSVGLTKFGMLWNGAEKSFFCTCRSIIMYMNERRINVRYLVRCSKHGKVHAMIENISQLRYYETLMCILYVIGINYLGFKILILVFELDEGL
ncbi:hypothetical protein AGLY_012894 [Aphis glycines]|uniref:Uncharacterized protein n=1 Tax=Aphis glycines TaxID=307491 RepID=A0A6G0T7Y4_APHGL|nr:hypothetical protein AGLY_012894 [Aphis glycines]